MKRELRTSEIALMIGLVFILLFMVFHDWVSLGSLNDVPAINAENTPSDLVISIAINAGQILLLMGMVLFFIGKKYPIWIKLWLIIHQSSIFIGAMLSWWIPYFFGFNLGDKVERYTTMFGNTHSFLPVMNGIAPNTIHTMFHSTLLICIVLTVYISFTNHAER